MRTLLSLVLAICVSVSVLALEQGRTAEAAFHCMRIHAVMGGFSGNNNIQYVELRMDLGGQTVLGGHTIQFFDAAGTLKATFTFPSGITNGSTGDSTLVATSEFNSNVTGGAADFTFSGANTVGANGGDPLHPVQLTGGSVVFPGFTCGLLRTVVDAVAYGSATATFGSAAAALPGTGTMQGLRLSNLNVNPSDNSAEYSLENVSTSTFAVTVGNLASDFTTPRNNGRTVLKLNAPVASVGGVAQAPDLASSVSAITSIDSDRTLLYAIAGALAAVAATFGGWYLYRRRAV